MSRKVHSTWTEVTIHTAKCDRCNKHNKAILYRCSSCGFQICTPCREADPDDGEHTMNGGERPRPRMSLPLLGRRSSEDSSRGETSRRQEKRKRRSTFSTDKEDLDGDWKDAMDGQRQLKRRDIRTEESATISNIISASKVRDRYLQPELKNAQSLQRTDLRGHLHRSRPSSARSSRLRQFPSALPSNRPHSPPYREQRHFRPPASCCPNGRLHPHHSISPIHNPRYRRRKRS